jgi:hypothetical protein
MCGPIVYRQNNRRIFFGSLVLVIYRENPCGLCQNLSKEALLCFSPFSKRIFQGFLDFNRLRAFEYGSDQGNIWTYERKIKKRLENNA